MGRVSGRSYCDRSFNFFIRLKQFLRNAFYLSVNVTSVLEQQVREFFIVKYTFRLFQTSSLFMCIGAFCRNLHALLIILTFVSLLYKASRYSDCSDSTKYMLVHFLTGAY